ncbi:hypothetical protein SODALDRAFT_361742 [Sodiomyces alkalinus F11]|uniref:Wax synthase domain-containing protein n=1 Tax=Sodiomyces alkalinus (strain CBS 110278 / VKM F-3762 / F11) TaxID=1314773 RepID=A0A3N2PR12_SODAK|nr:hypothetical protein SODALDRAFT_361742 [Sodiomyces alkalinus F11]ROT36910.1 hypothetical protein SODALDRAFT_361742 [Sodiomyces alkalinus F11]
MANGMEPPELLAVATLTAYRDAFKAGIDAGRAHRFTIPYHFIPGYVIPILYMSIPHVRRPWLYRCRWLVVILVVGFNANLVRNTSSTNVALAYAAGLWGYWSIMHNLTMLVWSRPQSEAERVARRRREKQEPQPTGTTHSGSRSRDQATAPGSDTKQFEYYWQAFPVDGTFLERLEWAFDLYSTFRGAGWNWAVPNIPSPQRPEKPLSGELVKMDTIPLKTRTGYATYPTVRDFVRTKVMACVYAYVVLDVLKVLMMRDPWWILGPGHLLDQVPLPPYLDAIPTWFLGVSRSLMMLLGMHAAIVGLFSLHDLLQYYITSCVYPLRAELWRYSSVFGSLDLVLDRGLAGFWGACWHQTFRAPFAGPGTWLSSRAGHHLFPPRSSAAKAATAFFAFFQSGILHGCGSRTSLGPADPLYPMLFFLLSGAGILLQRAACVAFRAWIDPLPRRLRRAGNLAYVVLWLHFTSWPLAADLAHAGIWLLEPVPLSFVRALGFGQVDHALWRIDDDTTAHWRKGNHWWQSGLS